MKYVIVIVAVLALSFFAGAVLAIITPDDEWEQMLEDEEQEEFLRKWREKRKRS